MSRFRVGFAVLAMIAIGVFVFTGGAGVANAAPIPGGPINTACIGTTSGSTFTLTQNCGDVTSPLTVPSGITTVDGDGFTISAQDPAAGVFVGGVVMNTSPGQSMNIENLKIQGAGFRRPDRCDVRGKLFGIWFSDASGTVNNVTIDKITDNSACPPNVGIGIRTDGVTAARTVSITKATVTDY